MSFEGFSSNKVLLLIIALLIFSSVKSQSHTSTRDSVRYFLDSLFQFAPEKALYAEHISWDSRQEQLMKQADTLHKFADIFPQLQLLFDDMKDNHSFFWHANTKYASNFGQLDESDVRPELIQGLELGQGVLKVETMDEFLYVRIPSNSSSDDFEEMQISAQEIQEQICEQYHEGIKGWIIDLRLNTGGNMYPMILGISQLLGNGVFAGILKRGGEEKKWLLRDLSIYEAEKQITALKSACLPDVSNDKVVLLTSEITGSSGEIVTLAFLGRKNTRIIGEELAGYMTSNELYRLPFETFLLLSEGRETDRNGIIVESIMPDQIIIEGDNFTDLSKDSKVGAAKDWLRP